MIRNVLRGSKRNDLKESSKSEKSALRRAGLGTYHEAPTGNEHAGIFDGPGINALPKKRGGWKKARLIDKIILLPRKKQIAAYMVLAISFIIYFYMLSKAAYLLEAAGFGFKAQAPAGFISLFIYLAKYNIKSFLAGLIISCMLSFLTLLKYIKKATRLEGEREDDQINAYESNNWLNKDETTLINTFSITDPQKPVGTPVALWNDKLYCIPDEPAHDQATNQNICIIGTSGGGKTYSMIEPIILSSAMYSDSIVISDTKGDIYRKYGKLFFDLGYDVKVFNMIEPEYSDGWDCLKEITKASEDNAWNLVNIYTDTIIMNTGVSLQARGDYWTQNEQNLLRGVIFFVARSPNFELKYPGGKRNFGSVIDILTENSAEELSLLLRELDERDPARITSAPYTMQSEKKIQDSTKQGLLGKLIIMQTPAIKAALSYDDIDFVSAVQSKTVIFIITADYTGAYDVITSLFVTSLYNKLVEISNSPSHKGKLKRPFRIILDEMCNMASISELSRKISTSRSRNIHLIFAIQSISQLEGKYPRLAENILSNCGTVVAFGDNEPKTSQYIAKRCGKIVRRKVDETFEAPPLMPGFARAFSRRKRYSVVTEDLITPARVEQLRGEIIVLVAQREAFKAKPYPVHMHPLARKLEETPTMRCPAWKSEMENDKVPGGDAPDKFYPSDFENSRRIISYKVTEEEVNKEREEYFKKQEKNEDGPAREEKEYKGARNLAMSLNLYERPSENSICNESDAREAEDSFFAVDVACEEEAASCYEDLDLI